MKVILFKKRKWNLSDFFISLGTGDNQFTHAGIVFNDFNIVFESSGFKGGVVAYRNLNQLKNKKYYVYDLGELGEDLKSNAINLIGTKYDFWGILFFIFNKHDKNKLYCFEFVAKILKQIGGLKNDVNLVEDGSISGVDIKKILEKNGFKKTEH